METGKYREYLAIDDRWVIFGTNSFEEHIQKNVVRGIFYNNVPKDIVDDFKTIEYQQVYSHYHWPLMDEALNKGLRFLEMAIKLKAKSLDIPLVTSGLKPSGYSGDADPQSGHIDPPGFEVFWNLVACQSYIFFLLLLSPFNSIRWEV